jgi:Tfp pilus assembly protein PilF
MNFLPHLFAGLLLAVAGPALTHQGQQTQLEQINHRIEQQPDSQELYRQRGRIYTEIGAFEQARADFEKAEILGPAGPVAFDFGMLCYEMGDHACARQHMDRYIKTYPGHVAAYEYRARIARDAGDYPSALADLERFFELQASPTPGLYISASRLYEELDEPVGGLAILDGGIDRLGMNPQLQRRAIEIELTLGHTGAAVKRWQSCRDVLKASVPWQVEMARLLIFDDQAGPAGELLRVAEKELKELRPTPARIKIGEEIRSLQKQLQAGESPG